VKEPGSVSESVPVSESRLAEPRKAVCRWRFWHFLTPSDAFPCRSRRSVAGNARNAAVTATDGLLAILIADPLENRLANGHAPDLEAALYPCPGCFRKTAPAGSRCLPHRPCAALRARDAKPVSGGFAVSVVCKTPGYGGSPPPMGMCAVRTAGSSSRRRWPHRRFLEFRRLAGTSVVKREGPAAGQSTEWRGRPVESRLLSVSTRPARVPG
jgi:hypothetical protein